MRVAFVTSGLEHLGIEALSAWVRRAGHGLAPMIARRRAAVILTEFLGYSANDTDPRRRSPRRKL